MFDLYEHTMIKTDKVIILNMYSKVKRIFPTFYFHIAIVLKIRKCKQEYYIQNLRTLGQYLQLPHLWWKF